MGKVIIHPFTTKNPITMIGYMAGVCYGSDITDDKKNYKRGIDCLESQHGRTWEFPDVYMTIEGYSARVMREIYTHIGGSPTRLQASTRYINYKDFSYYTPPSIKHHYSANKVYEQLMNDIKDGLDELDEVYNIPKEDSANGLPLGMESKMVAKYNFRTLADMSHQRECVRAYHEYRKFFADMKQELSNYSEEWAYLVEHYFMPKCECLLHCPEKFSCGKFPKKEVVLEFISSWRAKKAQNRGEFHE